MGVLGKGLGSRRMLAGKHACMFSMHRKHPKCFPMDAAGTQQGVTPCPTMEHFSSSQPGADFPTTIVPMQGPQGPCEADRKH